MLLLVVHVIQVHQGTQGRMMEIEERNNRNSILKLYDYSWFLALLRNISIPNLIVKVGK